MPTNHDLALQMLERAKRENGLRIGGDYMSVEAVQAMFNSFIAYVPEQEVPADQEMMIFGVKPDAISIGYEASKPRRMIYDCDTCGFAPSTQDIPQFGANWRRCSEKKCRGKFRWHAKETAS